MREIRTSGSMSGVGNGTTFESQPRLTPTLLKTKVVTRCKAGMLLKRKEVGCRWQVVGGEEQDAGFRSQDSGDRRAGGQVTADRERGCSPRHCTANRLEAHQATVRSRGEADGDHVAWAQLHAHMLHSCEDEHA